MLWSGKTVQGASVHELWVIFQPPDFKSDILHGNSPANRRQPSVSTHICCNHANILYHNRGYIARDMEKFSCRFLTNVQVIFYLFFTTMHERSSVLHPFLIYLTFTWLRYFYEHSLFSLLVSISLLLQRNAGKETGLLSFRQQRAAPNFGVTWLVI